MPIASGGIASSRKVIRASAGSGKTFQLSSRYLALALSGVPLETLFASTFTKKAAGEILERVLKRLVSAVLDDGERAVLAKSLIEEGVAPERLSRDALQSLLVTMVRHLHHLRIGTLDSFLMQLIDAFSIELELPPHYTIAEEADRNALIRSATAAAIASDTTSAMRLANLLFKGEAVRSLSRQIVEQALDFLDIYRQTSPDIWRQLPYQHELNDDEFERLLDAYAHVTLPVNKHFVNAHTSDLDYLRTSDWGTAFGKGIVGALCQGKATYQSKLIEGELLSVASRLASHVRATVLNDIARQTEATGELLEKIDREFRSLQHRDGVYSFSDMASLVAHPPRELPADVMRHRLDAQTHHLLLDEFQDTSSDQWQLIQPLMSEMIAARGSFFCVGDTKQAIYGWRGGVAEIFGTVTDQLPDAVEQPLDTSWRSSPVVLECVNSVFGTLTTNKALTKSDAAAAAAKVWQERFHTHSASEKSLSLPGCCSLETAWRAGDEHPNIWLASASDLSSDDAGENEEGATVEQEINKPKQGDVTLQYAIARIAEIHHRAPNQTLGVLVRRNEIVARLVAGLQHIGLEASEEGGNPLTDAASVRLIVSVLRLGDHPGDLVARFHIINSPLAETLSLVDVNDHAAANEASLQIRSLVREVGCGEAICRWSACLERECSPREWQRLQTLIAWASQYDRTQKNKTRLDHIVSLIETSRQQNRRPAPVRVMSIHQSKGLEFDIVVLPELDGRYVGQQPQLVVGRSSPIGPPERVIRSVAEPLRCVLPSAFQQDFATHQQRQIEEALCLLYVAMTRAKQRLVMIVAPRKPTKKAANPLATLAEIIKQALAPDVDHTNPAQTLYTLGDAQSCCDVMDKAVATPPVDASKAAAKWSLAPIVGTPTKWLTRHTPSAHDNVFEAAALPQRVQHTREIDRETAMLFGTAVHSVLEQVTWLDNLPHREMLREIIARRVVRHFNRPEQLDLDVVIEYVEASLQRQQVRDMLSQQGTIKRFTESCAASQWTLEVATERQFVVRDGDAIMRGSFDRVVVARDKSSGRVLAVEVIDFKTDTIADADRYTSQMKSYHHAAKTLYNVSPAHIRTEVVFLGEM